MSRKAQTTVVLKVRMELPPGTTIDKALTFVRAALDEYARENNVKDINVDSLKVSLSEKHTTY